MPKPSAGVFFFFINKLYVQYKMVLQNTSNYQFGNNKENYIALQLILLVFCVYAIEIFVDMPIGF